MKFGGTSVAGTGQWTNIAALLKQRRDEGRHVLIVCSALAGVTDRLVDLAAATAPMPDQVRVILDIHAQLANGLGIATEPWLSRGHELLVEALAAPQGPPRTAAVLAMGEWFSSQLGAAYLSTKTQAAGRPAVWVDARDALAIMPEPLPDSPRAWLGARCASFLDPALGAAWAAKGDVLVTQGFVARTPDGRTALLGRSGSDTSAALLGARLGAEHVEIWTDVPGIYSADPRVESGARLIPALGWEAALEMAASGARVIHGRSIRAAATAGIELWIRDLADPTGTGTRITAHDVHRGAKAVVTKPHMLVLLLRNLDTRQQVGFLAGVFKVFSDLALSVDQVATSETTTTLAIDVAGNHLDADGIAELIERLAPLCQVESFHDCTCVSVVGQDVRLELQGLAATRSFFAKHPLYMMSHSAADRSVSLLVPREAARELAHCLHEVLVVNTDNNFEAEPGVV